MYGRHHEMYGRYEIYIFLTGNGLIPFYVDFYLSFLYHRQYIYHICLRVTLMVPY